MINKSDNGERIERIKNELQKAHLDALVCTLPTNVLLLSGYWPVVGSSIAIATSDGRVVVIAPADEQELAELGWAEVDTFQPGSLAQLPDTLKIVQASLTQAVQKLGIERGRVGYEGTDMNQPASYASMHLYSASIPGLINRAMPQATLADATSQIIQLRSAMTPAEVGQMRTACEVAGFAFQLGANQLRPGLRETEVAAAFEASLSIQGVGYKQTQRAGGFAFCMSGPNSALAGRAYARSRSRQLEAGDLVLLHLNSYIDGYWTDITRTYCLGQPTAQQRQMYAAMFEARAAAHAAIRPGVRAATVDKAARDVMVKHGFGENFTHSTGHNVGFAAIGFNGPPRLHPASPDVLEVGMVFNVEPAIYIKGFGGMRHCDVVTVTPEGMELLTPYQSNFEHIVH